MNNDNPRPKALNARRTRRWLPVLAVPVLLAATLSSRAQWLTQSFELKSGWNAVFFHVDASHTNLNGLVGGDSNNPIQEIWRWNPPSVAQFTASPAQPTATIEWTSWNRTNTSSGLLRLIGDSAYLVRVGSNVANYSWSVKGRPVAPRHDWTISGLNLLGFSTVPTTPPNFKAFLAQATEFQSATPEIFHYPGGDLSTNNPVLIASPFLQQLIPVKRGQAFWVRSGTVFNRYFGPFEVVQSGGGDVNFRETSSSASFRLRNLTTSNLTITLRLVNSETAPSGQTAVAPLSALILRGSLNLTNLTYGYTNLPADSPRTWTLAGRNLPGSEVEVVLGLNRAAIANPPGSLLAGILRFTDSLGYSQVDVPASATASSSAGLWVGSAVLDKVGQYLVSYERGNQTNYVEAPNGETSVSSIATNQLVQDSSGRYIATTTNTSLAAVPRPFAGRLILHNPTNGNAVLLQRVYSGFDRFTNVVVATGEAALDPARLKDARRISSTFLPWTTANTAWALSGRLGQATILSSAAPVRLLFNDQASNPFLHTYHPDHDNLNATFDAPLLRGVESYAVERAITLNVTPATDFSSIVTAADSISGGYAETITLRGLGSNSRSYQVSGSFVLSRISQVPTLTLAP